MGRTVAELNDSISSDEIAEWAAYYQIDPFGSIRGDMQAGIITSNLMNIHLKKGATPLKPQDFMPRFGEPEVKKTMSPKEIHARLQTMMARGHRG